VAVAFLRGAAFVQGPQASADAGPTAAGEQPGVPP
jgi:hypothetical protein